MATKTVNWCTDNCCLCDGAVPSSVDLVIPATLLEIIPSTVYGLLGATLTGSRPSTSADSCGTCNYVYTFSYNDENLVSGTTLLAAHISNVICTMGSLGQDIPAIDTSCDVVRTCLGVEDTTSIDLNYLNGVFSADLVVSTDENNALTVQPDGVAVLVSTDVNNALTVQPDGVAVLVSTDVNNALTVLSDGAAVLVSSQPGNRIQLLSDGLFVGEDCDMGCCEITPWVDFSSTAVVTVPGTGTPTIYEARYKRANGVVFLKFVMTVTLAGTTGTTVNLIPPIAGVPDHVQAGYNVRGLVNNVEEDLQWRYDLTRGQLIFFRAGVATITNGIFWVVMSDFYEEAV